MAWRRPEQERVQRAIGELMTLATTQAEIAERVLAPAADIVGARALAVRNAEGAIVGAHNLPDDALADSSAASRRGSGRTPRSSTWRSPGAASSSGRRRYAPFFGEDELALLRTLGALTGLALDRVRLFEAEHQARIALERTNEVMAEFISLAAHELRTPVTTIYGFVRTLRHLSERLTEEQREELGQALEQQTERMTLLVEQLLDLSRLDAQAVEIRPEQIRSASRSSASSPPSCPTAATTSASTSTRASRARRPGGARPHRLEPRHERLQVRPPAGDGARGRERRRFRLVVEDSGDGVTADFVPSLFDRFSRSEGSRGAAPAPASGSRSRARTRGRTAATSPTAARRGAARVRARPSARRRDARSGRERGTRGGGAGVTAGGFGVVQLALLGEAVDALDGVAVFVWNEERRYVAVNDEACWLVGRSREQILGMEVGELTRRAAPMSSTPGRRRSCSAAR